MFPPDPMKALPRKAPETMHDIGGLPPVAPSAAANPPEAEAAPAAPPPALSAMPGPGTLLHAFRRCWKYALPLAVLGGAVGAAAAWFLLPPQFTSVIVFRILSRAPQGSLENEDNFLNVQRAQVATLTSHDVLAEALARSQVEEKYGVRYTPPALAKKLVSHFNQGPEMMYVQLSGDDAEAVAALLAAVGEVYPRKVQAADEARVKERIAQLRGLLEDGQERRDPSRPPTPTEQLHDKRAELARMEKDKGIDDTATINAKYQQALGQLTAVQRIRSDKQVLRQGMMAEVERKAKLLKQKPEVDVSDSDAEDTAARSQDFQKLMTRITEVRDYRAYAQAKLTGDLRRKEMAKYSDLLKSLEEQRANLIAAAREKLVAKRQVEVQQRDRQTIAELRGRIEQLEKEDIALDAEVRRWTRETENFRAGGPKVPPEVMALRDQVELLEKFYRKVGDDLTSLKGSLPLRPRVTVHAPPYVPTERDLARPMKISLAVGVLMFLGVIAGLCFLEANGRRVYTSDDVMQGLGLRVVGTLPRLPASARHKSASAQSLGGLDRQYGLTESIDALRTVLMHSPRVDGARVVLVTSAIGGEGKTTLASHLAASLARAWRKTLLIDGDLRKPAAHTQFDLPLEPGLSEALRGEVEYDDTIKPTMTSRLWLMPAGKVDGHSLQALAQDGIAGVFERLKEQYDFIVVDTSPVLLAPDGLLLAQQADTVLLSVLRDHSRLPAVYAAQQKLESLGIRVLGTVMIGEKTETYGHAVPYPQS